MRSIVRVGRKGKRSGSAAVVADAELNALDSRVELIQALIPLRLEKELGRSFQTTNCIENLNALIGQRTDKVDCWRNADQKHRWLATALLDIGPRLRKVSGYRALPRLRAALEAQATGTVEKVA